MPWKENQPRLMEYFASIPLERVVRKKLFGKRYITMFHLATTLAFQYETGALLGHAMRNKLNTLHKILVKPGTDIDRSIATVQIQAEGLLNQFITKKGKEPKEFYEFIAMEVLERESKNIEAPMEPPIKRQLKELRELYGRELALSDYYTPILLYGTDGLGFGGRFPELTVKMYYGTFESDMKGWAEARSFGVPLPEKQDFIPLEEREKEILQIVATYASEFYPEFVDALDLKDYLNGRKSN